MLKTYLILGDAKIEVRYVDGEQRFAVQAFDVLDGALPAIISYFDIAQPFPKVRVILVANRAEFDRLVRDLLGVEIEVPSHPARIAQPQRTDLVALSPSAYHSHSTFEYVPDQFGRLLVHELVHMVEEHLSPNIEASPCWWGEELAVYLSGQWLHDDEFKKTALDGVAQRNMPGFRQVEVDTRLAYDWGWTIVRFIEHTYGKDMNHDKGAGNAAAHVCQCSLRGREDLATGWLAAVVVIHIRMKKRPSRSAPPKGSGSFKSPSDSWHKRR